jgi:hypothetical protein
MNTQMGIEVGIVQNEVFRKLLIFLSIKALSAKNEAGIFGMEKFILLQY